jgi:hypothetical protein
MKNPLDKLNPTTKGLIALIVGILFLHRLIIPVLGLFLVWYGLVATGYWNKVKALFKP